MELKKVDKAIWLMEKEGEMRVPAYIFANDRLIDGMKKDKTLEQLKNVAGLPGIIKHALLMPDGHEGYGFPIGGVAAFDAEEGVVSPGGVGYDINCISEDAKVLTEEGYKRISEFPEKRYRVMSKRGKELVPTSPSFFMSFTPRNKVLEIITECGSKIRATEDHPFLTPNGMRILRDLKIGELLVMSEDGFYTDAICEIREINYHNHVYDFTIPRTHNFIANNFVVSNCGVRLLTTPLHEKDVRPKIRELCDALFKNVPSGVGSEGRIRVEHAELDEAVKGGVDWALERGYGTKEDKEHCEEYGRIDGADPSKVSPTAKKRGKQQFGTLGAGNHFLEVQVVEKVYNEKVAKEFGLHEGMITTMIHCGSRGYGHQICSDSIPPLLELARRQGLWLPDKELAYAPMKSAEAQNYLAGMRCAVNYAFTNRHIIAHWVRETYDQVFGKGTGDEIHTVYDVAHNIAKIEEHEVDGRKRRLVVHRKGATRAFPAGRPELPRAYRNIGQPVLIPGSMGTASYVLVGNPKGLTVAWGTTCHGSGRTMSRGEAIRTHNGKELAKSLWERNKIYVRATEPKVIAEEAPDAYKNIDDVVQSVVDAGISDIVARLKPLGVAKG